jgi:hypothetical protein
VSQPEQPSGRAAPIYDQLPGESALWYGRFLAYCNLGPFDRSVLSVYNRERQRKGSQPASKPTGDWTKRTSQYRWAARSAAWDAHQAEIVKQASEEALRQDATERARAKLREQRRKQHEEDEWELRGLLIAKGREMLAHPLLTRKGSQDGKSVTILPAKWSLLTMVEILTLATRLGRTSSRMPVQAEPEVSGDLGATFFETSGKLADVLPDGAVPAMPIDAAIKPPIGNLKPQAGRNGSPAQPKIERPDREQR